MRATIAAFLLPLALLRAAAAGDARFVMPKSETFEGVPLQVLVEVNDAADVKAPAAPDIPGATVRVLERGRQQMSEFRNGRVKTSTSITYAVEITPERTGALEIPAIEIVVDGKRFTSRPQHVDVRRSDAGDVLSAEIFGQPPEVFIGQPLEVVLRIAIRPYKDQAYGQLNESQMWQLVDLQNSQWGVFEQELVELHQRNASPRVQQETRDGQVWFVYELTRRIWPPKTGAPEVGDIRIRMTYPLALREVPTLFFERQLTISESRPLAVTASPTGISVLPLPEAGKTPAFTGAVGRFSFSVAAKPTTVAVGDPLTLTLTVTDLDGGANMETLQPPALAASAALAKDFRVPNEPLSGVVTGNAKRFTVTVRPLRAGTTELPPIDFSSFDPKARKYVTARSAPVPITVTPSTQMDLSKIVSAGGTAPTEQAAPGTKLTEVAGGLVANRPVTTAMVRDDERIGFGGLTLAGLVLPPFAAAAAFGWRLHRARHERDGGLARRSRALRSAESRLRSATDAAGIAGAVTGFVEDMTGRAQGTITRGDMVHVLVKAGVDAALRERVSELLARCDRNRYSGAEAGGPAELSAEAGAIIDSLDSERLRAGNGGSR
jgi:BatD DUF11 like domain